MAHQCWIHPGQTAGDSGSSCLLPSPLFKPLGCGSRLQSLGVGTDVSSLAQPPSTQKCGPGLLEWPRKMEHGGKRTELGREDKGGCPVGLGKGDAQGK